MKPLIFSINKIDITSLNVECQIIFYIFCPFKKKNIILPLNQGKIMDNIKKRFGSKIKEIREKRGLNQEQLAELIDMESRHLSRIETGKSFTTLENIEKIAKILDVNINTLFSFEHKKDKNELIKEVNMYLKNASQKEIELIYKIILDIFN